MSYLMYAINPEKIGIRYSLEASSLQAIEEGAQTLLRGPTQNVMPFISSSGFGGSEYSDAECYTVEQGFGPESFATSPLVPIVKHVLEYARQRLSLPEVRRARSSLIYVMRTLGNALI